MEWFALIGAILVAVNCIVLIDLTVRQSRLESQTDRIVNWQEAIYKIADRLEDDVNGLKTNVDCVWDNTERISEGLDEMNKSFNTPTEPEMPEELTVDVSDLSQNELERLARKREFDERIANLRVELGYESYGTHAEEILPEVKNLPHNIIPTSLYDLPDVEIAE